MRPAWRGTLRLKGRDHETLSRIGRIAKRHVVVILVRRGRRSISSDNSDLARIIFFRQLEALARHCDKAWLFFVYKRSAVFHAKSENFLVVAGFASWAIFHTDFRAVGGEAVE